MLFRLGSKNCPDRIVNLRDSCKKCCSIQECSAQLVIICSKNDVPETAP